MSYSEEVACFDCEASRLVGILARPQNPLATGVVIVVGGPQYRVGSHRQFVLLARALAADGYPVLRFDYRGMGDSEGEPRDFQGAGADIAAAISCLQQQVPEVSQVALWGLCDGASAALLYCQERQDARVSALCLANPWIRSEHSLARTQVRHYYARRLLLPAFWRKLLHGGVRADALPGLLRTVWTALRGGHQQLAHSPQSTFQQRMASAWDGFGGRIFLLLSENDTTAKEFLDHASHDSAWRNTLRHPNLVRHLQAGADHTFSSAALRARVAELTRRHGLNPPQVASPTAPPTAAPVAPAAAPPAVQPTLSFTAAPPDESAGAVARPAPHTALGPTA